MMPCPDCGARTRGNNRCQVHKNEAIHGDQAAEMPLSDGGTRSFSSRERETANAREFSTDPDEFEWRVTWSIQGHLVETPAMDHEDAMTVKQAIEGAVVKTASGDRPLCDDERAHTTKRYVGDLGGGEDE